MLVYIVAILDALAHLGAVPLWAVFFLSTEGGLRAGAGVSAFERRFAMRRAQRASGSFPAKKRKSGRNDLRRAWSLLRRLRGARFSLRGRLGLGNAAATALACGALRVLGPALVARAGRADISVAPEFDSAQPRIELQGMIRVRVGQIILAGARSGMNALLKANKA